MDPIQKLYLNRNKLRENNLKKEIEIWKYITQNITEEDVEYHSVDSETIKFKLKKRINVDIKKEEIQRILTSIASQIFKVNAAEFDINNIDQVNLSMVLKKINLILNSDKEIQKHFCTIPNKQGADEKLQTSMLNEEMIKIGLRAHKPSQAMYLNSLGQIINTKTKNGPKSIDLFVSRDEIESNKFFNNQATNNNELIIMGYQKVIMVSGGHQDNQLKDIYSFINAAEKYKNNNNDNKVFFIVQADGHYCKNKMNNIHSEIKNKRFVFAGSTLEVIKWIKDVKEKL